MATLGLCTTLKFYSIDIPREYVDVSSSNQDNDTSAFTMYTCDSEDLIAPNIHAKLQNVSTSAGYTWYTDYLQYLQNLKKHS